MNWVQLAVPTGTVQANQIDKLKEQLDKRFIPLALVSLAYKSIQPLDRKESVSQTS